MTFIHAPEDTADVIGLPKTSGDGTVPRVSTQRRVPLLTDGEVTLRAHHVGDVAGVYEQCHDPLSQEWTTIPLPYSWEDAQRFVTQLAPQGWREGRWAFAVEAPDDQGVRRFCGTVELRDHGERRAEVAYGAHPWVRGRGVMARALRLLLDWGFSDRGLETVIWWANKGNWASRKLAWRLGFSFDGTVRRWLPQRGTLRDGWVGALLATDARQPSHAWLDVPTIHGDRVVLRRHREADLPRIVEACSDERTAYWLGEMPSPYTLASAEAFLLRCGEWAATGRGVVWAVADPDSDLLLGNISLFDLKAGREAEIGYWTHPDARGRGVMTEACRLTVRHGFIDEENGGLGLQRLLVYAAEENTASRHVIEANGFTRTGRERASIKLRDGRLVDSACYDLLAGEVSLS
jgi:RimJ/RimL family protein N-acetyltransferase